MHQLHRFLFYAVFTLCSISLPCTILAEIPIGGQVLGPDGKGLKGIRVGLEPVRPDYDRVEMRLNGDVGPGAIVEVTTDAEGFFELLAPKMGPWKMVVPWGLDGEVKSKTPDYVAREYYLRPLVDPIELAPVTLEPASMLALRILDQDGAPVDARLGLTDNRGARNGWRSRLRMANSGVDGLVSLPRSAKEELQLELLGPNHPLVTFLGDSLRPKGKARAVEFKLPPGVIGTVRVTDRRGHPVAGAIAYQGSGIVPLGRADEDGQLAVIVAPAEHEPPNITFVAPDLSTSYFEPRFAEKGKNKLTLTLEPRPQLRGQVVERESRDPVAGALVWESGGGMAETDARGNYELTLFPTQTVWLQAAASGYDRTQARKSLTDADAEESVTLVLSAVASVAGLVVDEDGNPLAGVAITAAATDLTRWSRHNRRAPSTRSNRQGRFVLSGLAPSFGYAVGFRKPGFAPAENTIEGLEAFEKRTGLRVVLGTGRGATGWVISENEAPVAGAEVRLVAAPGGDSRILRAWLAQANEGAPAVRTDAEGRFRLHNLAVDRYQLEVRSSGFAPLTVPGIKVEAGTGEMDLGTVVLTPGVRMEGQVLDSQGAPVAGAEIYRVQGQSMVVIGRTKLWSQADDAGRFVLTDLRKGETYQLVAHQLGYSSEITSGAARDGETIEIVLRPGGGFSGRVVNESGDPVPEAVVSANKTRPARPPYVFNRSIRPTRTDDQGRFRLQGLEPGEAEVSVRASGYQRYEIKGLMVPAGAELSEVEVVLVRGATLTGTVTLADGTPAVEVQVVISPALLGSRMGSVGPAASGRTDGEGRYQLGGLALGPAVIRAVSERRRQVSQSLEIERGTQRLDLAFESGSELSGRVIDENGQPVVGATLTLTASDEGIRSGGDGTFTFKDLPDGHYNVSAAKDGYAQAKTTDSLRVGEQPTAPIELVLRRGISLQGRIVGLEFDELALVRVLAFETLNGRRQRGLVDYEGRYRVANLSPGVWRVSASLGDSGRHTWAEVTIVEGQATTEVDLEFKSGYSVSGKVISAGEPRANVQVSAFGSGPGMANSKSLTLPDGRFQLSHLSAGTYNLHVSTGQVTLKQPLEIPTTEEIVIDFRIARVSGYVYDQSGQQPIAGATVQLERGSTKTTPGYAHQMQATTDSRGFFNLTVQAGPYRVIATKTGYGPADATVDLEPGQQWDGLELLLPAAQGVSFSVALDTGEVPSQVMLSVLDPARQPLVHGSFPVSDGEVRLTTVPPGIWEMLVQAAGSAVVKTSITVPGHAGQVRLPRGGALRIRLPELESQVLGAAGFAQLELVGLNGTPHYVLEEHYTRQGAWPMAMGEARVSRLTPGDWTYKIRHPDGRTWTGGVTVIAGTTVEVVVP